MKILVINGPNLNMLGIREPDKYGNETYDMLLEKIRLHCSGYSDVECEFFQSNHEGELVDRIQQAYWDKIDGIVINPAAYTHTSVAILDAVNAVKIPTAEVHISDVSVREDFRQVSYIRQACCFTVMGHGTDGYLEAIDYLYNMIKKVGKQEVQAASVASASSSKMDTHKLPKDDEAQTGADR